MDLITNWIIGITVVTLLIFLYKHLTKLHGCWEAQGVPTERAYPIIGTEISLLRKPMHEIDLERSRKHGRIYGTYLFGTPALNITDPEIIKQILVKDFSVFVNRQLFRSGLKMFDSGLLFAINDDWKRLRSVTSPTFSSGKLRKMTFLIKEISKSLTENVLKQSEKGETVDMKKEFSKFTIEVIATCAFGIHIDPFNNPDHPFIVKSKTVFQAGIIQFFGFILIGILPNALNRLKELWLKATSFHFFIQAAREIMEKRRKTPNSQASVDFLQLMLNSKDEQSEHSETKKQEIEEDEYGVNDTEKKHPISSWKKLDEDEIAAQCTTLLLAGHDNVANSIAFAAYNLAAHQDVQNRLVQEIDEAWEKDGDIDYDTVNKMTYLNAVVSETLRLHSVAIRVVRQAKEDYTIPSKNIFISKDTFISIPVYALHHDPEFFPDPEKFDPDRFLPENKDKIQPYTYLPFSDGPRNCIAMRFALAEIKLCLAYMLRHIRLLPAEEPIKPLDIYTGGGILQSKEVIVRPEKRR